MTSAAQFALRRMIEQCPQCVVAAIVLYFKEGISAITQASLHLVKCNGL